MMSVFNVALFVATLLLIACDQLFSHISRLPVYSAIGLDASNLWIMMMVMVGKVSAVILCNVQSELVKGHKRMPSDIAFQELTRRDALSAMSKELEKIVKSAPLSLQEVC